MSKQGWLLCADRSSGCEGEFFHTIKVVFLNEPPRSESLDGTVETNLQFGYRPRFDLRYHMIFHGFLLLWFGLKEILYCHRFNIDNYSCMFSTGFFRFLCCLYRLFLV